MKDEYLIEGNYAEEMSEEYWEYQIHSAELVYKEIKLVDDLLKEKYTVELELYHHQ